MKQQSPYTRYARNWFGLIPNSNNQGELYLQTKKNQLQNEADFSTGANIYLQSLQEFEPVAAGSGKKQRKIKVFGIPENRIRKDEPIPELFGSPPDRSNNDERDQMLIDSNMNIPTNSLIEEPTANHGDMCDQNQLRNLLYCSGSSASLPIVEPLAQSNRAESVRTDEIDHFLQLELRVKEVEKQPSSISQSKINFPMKNTDSAYLSEDFKLKDQQNSRISGKNSFFLKELKEELSKEVSRSMQQQTIQRSNKSSQILHISNHQIVEQPAFGFDIISPIPKKYEEILQASVDYDQPKESKVFIQTKMPQIKALERPYLPLSTKADKMQKEPQNLNIKNYFQSYGSYQQQIENMVNKLQKVSDLKDKEKVIKRELQTLTHKKHQSMENLEYKQKSKPKSHKEYKPDPPNQRTEYNHAFTQSASHFLPREPEPLPRNSIDRQLHQDVAKMERILNKFKEISQIVSTEGNLDETGLRYHHQRSQKNLRIANYNNQMMFQSEKLAINSAQLPNYSCKKITSQPQIKLNIPERIHAALNDSQEIQSDNYTYKGMNAEPTNRNIDRPPIMPYSSNTVRTQKKSFNGLVERCQSNYNYELHTLKKCECNHAKLAQEVAKLTQKVQDLEKEKIREARSLDGPSHQKHKSIDSHQRSIHEESCLDLIPKQIQESIQSIKAKTGKHNPHHYSNLQPMSILKPPSTLQQHKSILKVEQARPSPTLTKRKTSKDLPPKPKNASKSPQIKKDPIKENHFSKDINTQSLKIGFPSIICCLTNNSSENSIIKFGQITYSKLFAFACSRQRVKGGKLEEKAGFKIKKYEDCIHYYLQNTLNYHLVCYFKGKLYFGQLKDPNGDCKHGFGYYSTPKYVYQGQFVLDKKNGKGKINYSNGDMYQGDWRNGKRQGHGIMVNLAGDIYLGTFQDGKKNGKGEQRLNNGDFYRGEFKEGKLQGEGTYWWSDGSVYQGGFKGGLLHGRGIWRSKENDCYEGQYRQNKKYGKGIYKWSNGMIFSGVFEADQQIPQNKQTLMSPDRKNSKSGQRTMRTRQNSSKKL